MQDFYEILNVNRTACGDEIKRSFRRMAKKYHPDRNSHRTAWAEQKTRLLIEAYRILSDARKRLEYDMELQRDPEAARKKFWARWEKARREDPSAAGKMKLVLHYLLTERGAEAMELYKEIRSRNGRLDLRPLMNDRDFLDCLFLLAEEFERTDNAQAAAEQYAEMYKTLRKKPARAYLHLEVRGRLYKLLTRILPRQAGRRDSMPFYRQALGLELSKSERAFVHKKLSECRLARGEREEALDSLRKAFELKPGLKGARKICEKLGFRPDAQEPQDFLKKNEGKCRCKC